MDLKLVGWSGLREDAGSAEDEVTGLSIRHGCCLPSGSLPRCGGFRMLPLMHFKRSRMMPDLMNELLPKQSLMEDEYAACRVYGRGFDEDEDGWTGDRGDGFPLLIWAVDFDGVRFDFAGLASLLLLELGAEEDIVGSGLLSTCYCSEMEKTIAIMAWTAKRLSVTTAISPSVDSDSSHRRHAFGRF
ncbi:hypothetical protein ACLOJK_026789 [Asimina triloba]